MMERRKNLNDKFGFAVVMKYNLLKDIAEITMGQSPDSLSYNNVKRGLPFYQGNADFGELYPIAKTWCDAPKKTAKKNDILISVRAPIGAINYTSELCCIGRGLAAITVEDDIDRNYIYYFLKAKNSELINQGTGSTFKAIGRPVLEMLKVPAISEKQKILIIKSIDFLVDIIKLRKKELILLDELIKARFIEMFGDININNKNWHTEHLGKLCNIVRGSSPRPIEKYLGGDIPWIKIGDATDEDNIYLNSTKEHIIREGVNKSRFVKKGSLIFANCGVSLGFARIISFDGCIHDGWLALENIDYRLNKEFLLLSLNQLTDHFRIIAPSGTQPNLNIAIMQNFMQVIPPMELQETFVSFRRHVDKSREEVKKSLEKTQQLYDSLMQKYFG